jgi:hypothetical protein
VKALADPGFAPPLTLPESRHSMTTPALIQQRPDELLGLADPPGPAGLDSGIVLVPSPEEDRAWHSCLPARHSIHQPVTAAMAAGHLAEPDEVLVADPRGSLTPSQMVEQRLLARLGGGHPGLFRQAEGGLGNIRRIPGTGFMGGTTGWYTFRIRSVNPPPAHLKASYKLTVTYQAPQERGTNPGARGASHWTTSTRSTRS